MSDNDNTSPRTAREKFADELVSRSEQHLEQAFGTVSQFAPDHAFHTLTHSRVDVLAAARRLAATVPVVRLLERDLVPLLDVAAIFHAADGTCGKGAGAAREALMPWPTTVFDSRDRELIISTIEATKTAFGSLEGLPMVGARIGRRLDGQQVSELSEGDLLGAVFADADRAHLGLPYGPHRLLLAIVERDHSTMGAGERSDGSDLTLGRAQLLGRLAAAAEECETHQWMLACSERAFPYREENAQFLREAIARVKAGTLAWPQLLAEAQAR